jgi:DNA-binding response OmpR family regulator
MDRQKILVFGEGGHIFRTICWVLEYKGYFVTLAPSPEAALALLIEEDFDLIIAKLNMEDLQSLDVLKRAKNLNPEVSVVVVSGDFNAAFPLEAYRIEVDDYLLLPITPSELMRRLEQCLQKVAELKRAKAFARAKEAQINPELPSRRPIISAPGIAKPN